MIQAALLLIGLLTLGATPIVVAEQFVFPSEGQSSDQQQLDEQTCDRLAIRETGQSASAAKGSADYWRTRAACLREKGYQVM